MGAWSKLALGENEYGVNDEHLGKWVFGKIYIFGGMVHREKWTRVQIGTKANGHLGKIVVGVAVSFIFAPSTQ